MISSESLKISSCQSFLHTGHYHSGISLCGMFETLTLGLASLSRDHLVELLKPYSCHNIFSAPNCSLRLSESTKCGYFS